MAYSYLMWLELSIYMLASGMPGRRGRHVPQLEVARLDDVLHKDGGESSVDLRLGTLRVIRSEHAINLISPRYMAGVECLCLASFSSYTTLSTQQSVALILSATR